MALCVILYTGLYTDYLISSKTLNFEHLKFLVLIAIVVVVSNLLLLPLRGLRLPSGSLFVNLYNGLYIHFLLALSLSL